MTREQLKKDATNALYILKEGEFKRNNEVVDLITRMDVYIDELHKQLDAVYEKLRGEDNE